MFIKYHKNFKINIMGMIWHLLKFSFVRNFHDKIMCCIWSYSFRHFETRLRFKNKWNFQGFFSLKSNPVIRRLNYLLPSISPFLFWIIVFSISYSLLIVCESSMNAFGFFNILFTNSCLPLKWNW